MHKNLQGFTDDRCTPTNLSFERLGNSCDGVHVLLIISIISGEESQEVRADIAAKYLGSSLELTKTIRPHTCRGERQGGLITYVKDKVQ